MGSHLWGEEDRGHDTPCWIWNGAVTSTGYGQFSCCTPAHRLSFETYIGAIPDGLDIDHLCRVRLCVNPHHLEPVTRAENLRRGKGTRLTLDDVVEIRRSSEGLSALAQRFGVSDVHIWNIRAGKKWKHI